MTELAHKPSLQTDSDPAKKKDRLIKGAALFAGTAAVAAALTGCGSSEKADSHSGANASAVDELPIAGDQNGDGFLSKDELHKMDPSEVSRVDPQLLLSAYGQDFDTWRRDTYTILLSHDLLGAEEKEVLNVPGGPKLAYSDQDVINQVTLDVADSSIQDDLNDGKRMLPLAFSPSTGGFIDTVNYIKKGNGVVLNSWRVEESYPQPKESFNGINLSRYAQARIIKQKNLQNNLPNQQPEFTEYGLYGLLKNDSGEEWQLIGRFKEYEVGMAISDLKIRDKMTH